jgi:hypothetical protein
VVERDAHKGMVIGERSGERLKRIGSEARQELEKLTSTPRCSWSSGSRCAHGWADDEEHLRSYGYEVSELRVSHAALSFACRRPGTDAALSPPERVRALGSAAAICLGRGEAAHFAEADRRGPRRAGPHARRLCC